MCPYKQDEPKGRNSYWLSRISCNEQKALIAADFSNSESRRSLPFSFFPGAFINFSGFSKEAFSEIAEASATEKFILDFPRKNIARLSSRNFSALGKTLLGIKNSAEVSYLLLNPERQFLLSKAWSYFEEFSLEGNNAQKLNSFKIPEATIGQSSRTIAEQALELIAEDESLSNEFLRKIALSRILSVRPELIPEAEMQKSEILLENIFFKNNFVPESSNPVPKERTQGMPFYDAEAIDFSWVWFSLLTDEKQNLGFETIDCSCCNPLTRQSENLLPNSIAEGNFLSDGIYFESMNPAWARNFHERNLFKNERLRYKNEWGLQTIPSGPFFRNQNAELLLADAQKLEEQGLVEISSLKKASFFCTKQESFLKKELLLMDSGHSRIKAEIEAIEKVHASEGLFSYSRLANNANYAFLVNYYSSLGKLACSIPNYLNSSGKYHCPEISEILGMRQRQAMASFKELCSSKGARAVFRGRTAYARGNDLLSIAREFSKKEKTKQPLIKNL